MVQLKQSMQDRARAATANDSSQNGGNLANSRTLRHTRSAAAMNTSTLLDEDRTCGGNGAPPRRAPRPSQYRTPTNAEREQEWPGGSGGGLTNSPRSQSQPSLSGSRPGWNDDIEPSSGTFGGADAPMPGDAMATSFGASASSLHKPPNPRRRLPNTAHAEPTSAPAMQDAPPLPNKSVDTGMDGSGVGGGMGGDMGGGMGGVTDDMMAGPVSLQECSGCGRKVRLGFAFVALSQST